MLSIQKGRYRARFAQNSDDLRHAQHLRYKSFVAPNDRVKSKNSIDCDRFDPLCQHVLIEDNLRKNLVGCYRLLPLSSGSEIAKTYAAQFYDLSGLYTYTAPMAELGRFCIDPDLDDPDILRIAWGAMARFVDESGVKMLFGCASFSGVEALNYQKAFEYLKASHQAPQCWQPGIKAAEIIRFSQNQINPGDKKRALSQMPPLLRTYLDMGAWVSDHAVVDSDLNTLHVFTGLEICKIPPMRARLLRTMVA